MDNIIPVLFYPTFLIGTFILTLIFIPRNQYKDYFIYGLLIGGLGDIIAVTFMQNLLGLMWFKNQGIFNVFGHIALSPLSWTVTVIIFLYFLPRKRWFLYPYILTWAAISLGYGYVVHNVGLFDFVSWLYPIPAYFIFLGWWILAAWLFLKTSPLARE
ncbi:MAG: hypothetical protein APF84_02130 [Gracilibacter sp. BRH_c7a]|nr:MAG: hypothetical protein APF84_02130 [Gracilibacter sp. BRH_c7a]